MTCCIHSLHNHAPYKEDSEEGLFATIGKRVVLSIIASALLAVATYYSTIAFNTLNLSPDTLIKFALFEACQGGVILNILGISLVALSLVGKNDPAKPSEQS